jgi:ParB-like chromosome segregation protein Spo0J
MTAPDPMVEGMENEMPVDRIRESDDNPRFISDEALERLKYALSKQPDMLRARPVICDEWGTVICGNMRLRAARELGWVNVPTFVHVFRDEAEKREWMLRDNQEYGDWVPDQLAALIHQHVEEGADTRLLGFDDDEVMKAVRRATGEAMVPEPSEPPEPTLVSEVMIEIRCSRAALAQIEGFLEDWHASIDELEISVSS